MKKSSDEQLQFDETVFLESSSNDYLELPISRTPFLIIGVIGILFIIAACIRLSFLIVARGDFYTARASANIHREIMIPAPRGEIYDSRGVLLATEEPTWSVVLRLGDLFRSSDVSAVARELSDVLDISYDDIMTLIARANPERQSSIVLVRGLPLEATVELKSRRIPGVFIEAGFRRVYPRGKAFSSVLGYVSPFLDEEGKFGRLGVEAYYDDMLRGIDGRQVFFEDVRGAVVAEKEFIAGSSGHDIHLTLDAELQQYVYDRLNTGLKDLGRTSGAAVVLDPRDGSIRALVSVPTFDNAIFSYFGRDAEKRAALSSPDLPFFNRIISGVYNPGSTIKPLIALAALEEKIVSPRFQIYSPGYIEIPNPYFPENPSRFVDWRPHGWVDVRGALARSSNVYFYEVGGGFEGLKGLGIERIRAWWDRFHFHQKTGIDLPGESVGFLGGPDDKLKRTGSSWLVGDTYNISIGQGDLSTTPIRLASFLGMIGMGGIEYQPHVVQRIYDARGMLVTERAPSIVGDYSLLKTSLYEVQEGLKDAVRQPYGTAFALSSLPIAVAAKTGTAQIMGNTRINAFFIGYAPVNNPEIVVLVLVENAREGSINTLPIARDIFLWYYNERLSL